MQAAQPLSFPSTTQSWLAPAAPKPPRAFITGLEGGAELLSDLIGLARHIKAHPDTYAKHRPLAGKILAAVYINPSLRTRTSFESGLLRLGGQVINLEPGKGSWNLEFDTHAIMDGANAEHIIEAAGVLSSYCDAIGLRAFSSMDCFHSEMDDLPIHQLATYADVPVISLESACYHPCQALADALTLDEIFNGQPQGKHFTLSWAYHPKMCGVAVPHSALLTAARLGMNVTVAHPEGYDFHPNVMNQAHQLASATGGSIQVTHDKAEAVKDTHVIYAKAWGSPLDYGNKDAGMARNAMHKQGWTIDAQDMATTREAAFMHCLPVRRNVVVTSEVLDSSASVVQQQAANRMWAQMALMLRMMG